MVGAAIGMGVGALQGIAGMFGARKAQKEMDSYERNRPIYSRPDEMNQYLEMAKTGANSQMPGTTQLAQNTQQSTQGMISKLEDSGRLDAGSIQQLYQSELGAYNNLAMQQAQYHQGQNDRLAQALGESAKYSDQEFEYNVNSPWQRKYQNAINKYQSNRNMMQAGMGTMANSLSKMTSTGGDSKSTAGGGNSNWMSSSIYSNPAVQFVAPATQFLTTDPDGHEKNFGMQPDNYYSSGQIFGRHE
jgi:hypothetical protein